MAAQHQTDFPVEEYKDEDDAIDSITGQEEDDVLLLTAEPVVHQGKCCILPEAPTFLYFLAVTTQYPVVQFWLFDHFSDQYSFNKANTTTEFCSSNVSQTNSSEIEVLVQSRTNNYVMYTSFVCNFTAIIPALLLGTLTDKLGRKFVFYISFFGLMVSQLLTLMIFLYNLSPDLLYIASFIQGLSGSYGLFLAAIFGIAADITAVGKKRGFRVAAIEASLAVSTSIGMLTSGIWVKEMGYVWPMAAALGEIFIATLYVFFFIPETIIERRQQPFSWRTLAKSVEFYFKDTPLKRRFRLIICLLCFLAVLAAFMGESNFGMLYLLHQPFCWPKEQITFFNGGLIFFKWVFVLVFLVIGKRCISEPVFALIGSLSLASGYLLKGLATSDLLIFVGAGTSVLGELVSPMCRTMMSRLVSHKEQGALFAGIGVLQMIVSAVSGIIMSNIYNVGLTFFLGLPYLVLTGLISINVFLLSALIIRVKLNPNLGQPQTIDEQLIN